MKDRLKGNKGITLIALVITIIVLLILAGVAISMLSGEHGILNQAAKAKKETEKASKEEAIQLAVLSAMTNTSNELTLETLTAEVKSQLGSDVLVEQDGIGGYVVGKNPDDKGHLKDVYGVVDKEGKVGEGKWHFVKLTDTEEAENSDKDVKISDGETTLIVGNIIDYSPIRKENGEDLTEEELKDPKYTSEVSGLSDNKLYKGIYTYKVEGYTGEKDTWGVLGVENGKVLIAPMHCVTPTVTDELGDESKKNPTCLYMNGQLGYQYGVNALNDISKIYGYGKGAESARSITVEDINKVTGYDPNYVGQNVNKTEKENLKPQKFRASKNDEYGNIMTYICREKGKTCSSWYKSNEEPLYTWNGSFTYWNLNKWIKLDIGESVAITSTAYQYYPDTLLESRGEYPPIGIDANSSIYKMLVLDTDVSQEIDNVQQINYWIGSSYIYTYEGRADFGMRIVSKGMVGYNSLYGSQGFIELSRFAGVRPAVILRSDVKITEEGGTYKIN